MNFDYLNFFPVVRRFGEDGTDSLELDCGSKERRDDFMLPPSFPLPPLLSPSPAFREFSAMLPALLLHAGIIRVSQTRVLYISFNEQSQLHWHSSSVSRDLDLPTEYDLWCAIIGNIPLTLRAL